MDGRSPVLLWLVAATATGLAAQQRPAFEVVSVRKAPDITTREAFAQRRYRVTVNAANAQFGYQSLTELVLRAWRLEAYQLDAPDWMENTRFDVSAKLPEGSSPDQVPEMLRSMLQDRFGLKFHRQDRELSLWALTVDRDGLKLAPRPANFQRAPGNPRVPRKIAVLTSYLKYRFGQAVVDRTNLEDEYFISLEEVEATFPPRVPPGATGPADGPRADQASEPPAATIGLLKKWGLELKRARLPISMLVVDHIDKEPSAN